MVFVNLCIMLVIILVAAEIFTNALEHLGHRLKISEGVTGSIFAAVGTALPETSIPLIALLFSSQNIAVRHDIGVGAILGAPLMLSTLAIFIMGVAAFMKRGVKGSLSPELSGLKRDLNYFIVAFLIAGLALCIPEKSDFVKYFISISLILIYFFYILQTIRASSGLVDKGHVTEADRPMFITRLGFSDNKITIVVQLMVGLGLIVIGARGFIYNIEIVSNMLGVSVLLLSILIVPIATELPEKINSVLWVRRGRDTLAFGNITGAMVFQGTILPAMGIMLTPWDRQDGLLFLFVATLLGACWLRYLTYNSSIKIWYLILNGTFYLGYLFLVLT